jgi:hypothetical protein
MSILKKLIPGWGREVVLKVYMIHERDSEFEWKPELEDFCRGYDAVVRSHLLDITYESARLDVMINRMVLGGKEVPESLLSRAEEIDDLLASGTHWRNRAFDIKILVDKESVKGDDGDLVSIGRLRSEVTRILEKSDPWYLMVE